jgi:Protein of unknown function (DUF2934)
MDQILMHRIRERAYHIWMETGGNADQNWLQAEAEIFQAAPPTSPDFKLKSLAPRKSREGKASAVTSRLKAANDHR